MEKSRDLVPQAEVVIKTKSAWLKYNGIKTLNSIIIVVGSVVVLVNIVKNQIENY